MYLQITGSGQEESKLLGNTDEQTKLGFCLGSPLALQVANAESLRSQCKSRASEPEPFRAVYFYTRLKWTAHSLDNLIHSHNRWHWPSEINPTQVSVHKVSVRENKNHFSKKAKAQNLLSRKTTNWPILFYTFLLSYAMYSGDYQIWDKFTPTLEAQFTSLHLSFYILQFFKTTHSKNWGLSLKTHFCSGSRERKSRKQREVRRHERSKKGTCLSPPHKARTMPRYHSGWHPVYKTMD